MKVLVRYHKHGHDIWAANTNEMLNLSCKRILKELLDDGYGPQRNFPTVHPPLLSPEEIEKLPEQYKKLELERIAKFETQKKEIEKSNKILEDIEKFLASPDDEIEIMTFGKGTDWERKVTRGYYLLNSVHSRWTDRECYVEDVIDPKKY